MSAPWPRGGARAARGLCALAALLPALPAQVEAPAQANATAQAPVELGDPAALPSAKQGRWQDWSPRVEPAPDLRAQLAEIGRVYREAQYPKSVQLCWDVLEREPDFPPALYQLGVTYFRLRRYRDSALVLERFLKHAPSELAATQALGHCYYSLGDYARAKEHYQAILSANAEASIEVVRGLALAHVRLGDLGVGLELLDRVLRTKPDYADVHAWRAQVLYDLERSEEALQAAQKACELEPFEPRGHFLVAQALRELGRVPEAARAEERFLELNEVSQKVRTLEGRLLFQPAQRDLLLRLVSLHKSAGNVDAVQDVIKRLLRLDPRSLELHTFALDTLAQMSAVEPAKALALVIERDFSGETKAWGTLRDFYGSIGDVVRQIQAGERYLRLGGERGR